ncbi:MAG: hypothetical protein PHO07_21415 [Pirellulales bacterium]|nr:hypothetical protein [Thermoguttaceae bacterium]MDD4789736.1 hypothetical protein [Pirellulales bacterium]MDI9446366.1 hypothetical protein [Planctomycetota bacterium]
MALKKLTIDEQERTVTIVMDLEEPTPSSSGKTLVVASTRGNMQTEAMLDGKPVIVGVNAYIKR